MWSQRLAYVGMSHSLGLKHRTKAYEALEGGSRKLKVAKGEQLFTPVSDMQCDSIADVQTLWRISRSMLGP